jgi:hypothetical protein
MTASEQADCQLLNHGILANDDFGQFSPQSAPDFAELVDGRHVIRCVAL